MPQLRRASASPHTSCRTSNSGSHHAFSTDSLKCPPSQYRHEKRRLWNRIKRLVSNKPVSLLFRIALPALSVAVLFYTLETAQREQHAWIAGRERAARTPITNNKIESIPFVLPFQHGSRIQDAIGFQWPAFVAAGTIAPVPQLFYAQMEPVAFTRNSYVALAFAVGIYWFLIGVWIDSRFVQRNRPTYSPIIRGTYNRLCLNGTVARAVPWQRPPRRMARRATWRVRRNRLAGTRLHNPDDRDQRIY